jgi:enoyl-CoA hydratase/carnithine racemase
MRATGAVRRLDGDDEVDLLGDGSRPPAVFDLDDPIPVTDDVECLGQPRRVEDRRQVGRKGVVERGSTVVRLQRRQSRQLLSAALNDWKTLAYEERDGGVAIVTLDREDVHNAFDHQMELELQDMWLFLRRNEDVNAVVLTGAGEKAFCTGIDRDESVNHYLEDPSRVNRPEGRTGHVSTPFMFNDPGSHICPKANDLWKPIITAVNGIACGGAFYFLGESDIIIAAEHATFFDPHVSYGMVAGFETAHLLQKVPFGEMLRIALMGGHERVSAARALEIGLVSEVLPADELLDKAVWIAERIAMSPPLAVQGTLKAAWMAHEVTRREAIAQMSSIVLLGTEYENIEAGQKTFHEKREKPRIR